MENGVQKRRPTITEVRRIVATNREARHKEARNKEAHQIDSLLLSALYVLCLCHSVKTALALIIPAVVVSLAIQWYYAMPVITVSKEKNKLLVFWVAHQDEFYFSMGFVMLFVALFFSGEMAVTVSSLFFGISLPFQWWRSIGVPTGVFFQGSFFRGFFQRSEKTGNPVPLIEPSPKEDKRNLKPQKEDDEESDTDLGFNDDDTQLHAEQGIKPWEAEAAALLEVLQRGCKSNGI